MPGRQFPVRYQIEAFGGIHDSFYQEKDKTAFINESVMVMRLKKKEWGKELAVLVLKKWGAEAYRQELEAALAAEKSKKIKELLQSCLGVLAYPDCKDNRQYRKTEKQCI